MSATTVKLDVGGQCYVVARDTIERFPDTMLANLVSQRWQQQSQDNRNEPLFIDRDGHRFRFVLDWMRDGEVHLPVTESYEAFRRELDYFGFLNVEDSSIIAGTLQGGQILTVVSSNMFEENDAMESAILAHQAKIEELRNHQHSNSTAHGIFLRSSNVKEGDTVTITLFTEQDKQRACRALLNDMAYFKDRLAGYGLKLVTSPTPSFLDKTEYKFVLKRIQEKKREKKDEQEGKGSKRKKKDEQEGKGSKRKKARQP